MTLGSLRLTVSDTTGGIYTLVIRIDTDMTVEVGALGERQFGAGWYAYVGSALGPGGFGRIDRHRELAAGERGTRHWHVDYLLGHPGAALASVHRSPGVDAECATARALAGERVSAFGCSDCDCDSHLVYQAAREPLLATVERAHDSLSGGD